MVMHKGNIIRTIGGESIKKAKKSITLTATHGDLTFNSPTQVIMTGKQGGVQYLNDYTPPLPLRVMKLDGPYDENGKKVTILEKEKWYNYKVIQFNRAPKGSEIKNLRWANQYDDNKIDTYFPTVIGKKEVSFRIPNKAIVSKFTVYAYFKQPTISVSVSTYVEKHSCNYIDANIIAEYMAKEMNTNIKSSHCDLIKMFNNKYSNTYNLKKKYDYFRKACVLWKSLVKKGAIWDHKITLLDMQNKKNWSCDKKSSKALLYNYDIWSNIHYGFVGKYVGFSEFTLINGAGYAQIGDNNKPLDEWKTWKEYLKNRIEDFGDSDILGGFDDPSDQQAIKIGFRLFDKHIENIQAKDLLDEIQITLEKNKPLSVKLCI